MNQKTIFIILGGGILLYVLSQRKATAGKATTPTGGSIPSAPGVKVATATNPALNTNPVAGIITAAGGLFGSFGKLFPASSTPKYSSPDLPASVNQDILRAPSYDFDPPNFDIFDTDSEAIV